jgi:hypothetical protein
MARGACVILTYKRSHAWCSAVLCGAMRAMRAMRDQRSGPGCPKRNA